MRRAVSTVARALRDFALGIHLANGIRHGVPPHTERPSSPASSRRPVAERPVEGGQIAPTFTQPFAGPVVAIGSRV